MLLLSPENKRAIRWHAEREYPQECCGFLTAPLSSGLLGPLVVLPVTNAQDRLHRENPSLFQRTARDAFFMEPRELLDTEKKNRESGRFTAVIYHSHIDADAYFSEEDERAALMNGHPAYPGVLHLVVSVRAGRANHFRVFGWSQETRRFEEILGGSLTETPEPS